MRLVAAGRAGRDVRRPVAVQVPCGGDGPQEVAVRDPRPVGGGVVYLGRPLYGAVRVHEHYVDGAAVGRDGDAVAVVPFGPRRHVLYPVAVDVPDAGGRGAEEDAVGQTGPVGGGGVDLGGPFHGAVRVHEQDVQRAPAVPARVVAGRADSDVRHPVAVQVPYAGHRVAELVNPSERRAVGRRAVYLGGPLYGAVRVEEHDVDRAGVESARVVAPGAGGQVRHAVAVQVPYAGHRGSKVVKVCKLRAVGRTGAYPRHARDGSVRIHEHHVHGAAVPSAPVVGPVVAGRAGGQVRHAVAVQVPYAGRAGPKVVVGVQQRAVSAHVFQHGRLFGRAVRLHESDVDGAGVVVKV